MRQTFRPLEFRGGNCYSAKENQRLVEIYTEVGAIVSFDSEASEEESMTDIVILRP